MYLVLMLLGMNGLTTSDMSRCNGIELMSLAMGFGFDIKGDLRRTEGSMWYSNMPCTIGMALRDHLEQSVV